MIPCRSVQLAYKILYRIPFMKDATINRKKVTPSVWIAHHDTIIRELLDEHQVFKRYSKLSRKKSGSLVYDYDTIVLKDKKLYRLCHYFDAQIAIYFGFLQFYRRFLYIPAAFGVIVFISQTYALNILKLPNGLDSPLLPWCCIFISLWSSLFLEYWKRRYNTLKFRWKTSFDDTAKMNVRIS
jgi:hypothetical protein